MQPISKFGCRSAKGVNANTTNITKCSKNIWQLLNMDKLLQDTQRKEGNKFTVWHKYYTDDLSDINIDTKFNTCQVLGSYDMKPSFKVDF